MRIVENSILATQAGDQAAIGRLPFLASLVAIETPEKRSQGAMAYVRWNLVLEIRDAMTAAGFDWLAINRDAKARAKARRRKLP